MKNDYVLQILRNFIFPLRNLFEEESTNLSVSFMVSLHEKNGIHINGLTIDERILEIENIDDDNKCATVRQICRYIDNLDFIRLSVDIDIVGPSKTYNVEVKTFADYYMVSVLNKMFKFKECPQPNDISTIVEGYKSFLKKVL